MRGSLGPKSFGQCWTPAEWRPTVQHATPIEIPEHQFLQLHNAAGWLCPSDRDQFLDATARALAGQEIGPGSVTRAIRQAFRTFYQPIEIPEEPQQLRKLSYGSNKLAAKFDAIEAGRQRRQRSDAL
jgi:hypothetical protein